jgi:hypothetical protein
VTGVIPKNWKYKSLAAVPLYLRARGGTRMATLAKAISDDVCVTVTDGLRDGDIRLVVC